MRKALLAGIITMSLPLAVPAFAQQQGGTSGQQGLQSGQGYSQQPMMGTGMMNRGQNAFGMPGERGRLMEMAEHHPGLLRALGSGLFIRIAKGDSEVDMHCPPRLAPQACVQAAKELLSAARQEEGDQSDQSDQSQSSGGQQQQ